jgi:hypothetical protein
VIAPPRTRTGRVPVPSWDDVLFGAIPTSDTTTADEPRADAPDVDAQDGSAPARRRRS